MDQLADAPAALRHARLKLRPQTLARLMQWQYQAVASGHPKPTYSDIIDALVAHSTHVSIHQILDGALEEAS